MKEPAALWPIYIPSRGRADTIRLPRDAWATVVVEPQELDAYIRAVRPHHNVEFHVLAEADQGLAYARNAIKALAEARGEPWFWMLDDDITGYFQVEHGVVHKASGARALSHAQAALLTVEGIGQGALEYQQYAWRATKPLALDSYCDVAVAINTAACWELTFRSEVTLKEDRDFTLQVLRSGAHTARTNGWAFSAPKNGSNAGGLQEEYETPRREFQASVRLAELWPGIVDVQRKRDGRMDAKINWRAARAMSQTADPRP